MRRAVIGLAVLVLAAGCAEKKKTPKAVDFGPPPATQPAAADPPPAVAPDPRNTNFQAGAGAVQNVRQAARRTVAINDMHQLGIFIKQMEVENGRMPDAGQVKDYIRRDAPKVAAMIDDGTIVLTGTKDPAGLWAHEVDADRAGGIVLVGGEARRAAADEVKQLLARK